MKPLDKLDSGQRAKMLHDLFPGEMRGLLDFSILVCGRVIDNADAIRRSWKNPLMSADHWIYLANSTRNTLQKNLIRLAHSGKEYADWLFVHQFDLFNADCICKFAAQSRNEQFKAAARLLFDFSGDQKRFSKIILAFCRNCQADYLLEAVNEAFNQQGKEGINAAGKEFVSHEALAVLAAQLILQTDKFEAGCHWIDKEGKYKVSAL